MANDAQVIAIVGLAGRFPGAAELAALAPAEPAEPVAAADAGWSRLVACAWEALHASGSAVRDPRRAGLFVAVDGEAQLQGRRGEPVAGAALELGLGGPAVAVAAAASPAPSSPIQAAVERACRGLRGGECDLALAGALAEGAAGVAALKRLAAALAEDDRIAGVVRGGAILPPGPPPGAARDGEGGPQPARQRPALVTEYAPPGNGLEAAIAAIWQEQLGVDRVGVEDNFFELGGTSLLGTRIVALLKEWLEQEIPTVSLYEGPTVSALARVILAGGGGGGPRRGGYDAVRERGERRRKKLQRLAQETAPGLAD